MNKSHGLNENDTMTYVEYLDNKNAEMSPDTAPTLIPHKEGDNVTMKNYYELLALAGEVLKTAQDISGSISVLDIEHSKIHEGKSYFVERKFTIAGSGVLNIVLCCQTDAEHLVFEINSVNAGINIEMFEGITSQQDGTIIPNINANGLSSNTSELSVRLNPTGISTAGATLLREIQRGTTGSPPQTTGGGVTRTRERILKRDTKYLIRITNLSSQNNVVNYYLSWYDNGQSE